MPLQHTHTRLTVLCHGLTRWASTRNVDFTEARDNEWWWHQLGHMQVCTLLLTDNRAGTPPLFYNRMPAAQPTASKHWRHYKCGIKAITSGIFTQLTVFACVGVHRMPMLRRRLRRRIRRMSRSRCLRLDCWRLTPRAAPTVNRSKWTIRPMMTGHTMTAVGLISS